MIRSFIAAVKLDSLLYLSVRALLVGLLLVTMLGACAGRQAALTAPVAVTDQKVEKDLRLLQVLGPQLRDLDGELHAFRLASGWRERGYFDAAETRIAEALLFRFVATHTALWDVANSYGGPTASFAADERGARAELVFVTAALLLASHSAELVVEFADDPIAVKQFNQVYFRSEIPFGTYDTMRVNVTKPANLGVVQGVEQDYRDELADGASGLAGIAAVSPAWATLVNALPALLGQADNRLQQVSKRYPSGGAAARAARRDARGQHKSLYKIRAVAFKDVSRLKSPAAKLIVFSAEQKEQVYQQLQPGDIVLTYTAGYMSSVFIPGAFKHGITFIGTPEQRQEMALSVADVPALDQFDEQAVAANLQKMTLADGQEADMIEAVAEGVIFNNLAHIMDTHINRMLVLRPQLSDAERRAFLAEIFTYLGAGYDFRFDFADATYQVCTEVIYRAMDGKAGIEFALTERARHVTLSADDVVNYYLSAKPVGFEFVLYAEKDSQSDDNAARIMRGDDGAKRIAELVAEQQ